VGVQNRTAIGVSDPIDPRWLFCRFSMGRIIVVYNLLGISKYGPFFFVQKDSFLRRVGQSL